MSQYLVAIPRLAYQRKVKKNGAAVDFLSPEQRPDNRTVRYSSVSHEQKEELMKYICLGYLASLASSKTCLRP
jgi:hypothetical protein